MTKKSISVSHEKTNRMGIYAHIPFCIHKCSYCDFYSFTKYANSEFPPFLECLKRELSALKVWAGSSGLAVGPASTLFVGGGTPSLLPAALLGELVSAVKLEVGFISSPEITFEANPETVSEDVARGLLEAGANRVSLGAQSFDPENLRKLERLCGPEAVGRAFGLLRGAGFQNLSLDLIFAIPGQTIQSALDDLKQAMELEPNHLSWYNLTLKPGHVLFDQVPDEDFAAEMYTAGIEYLESQGFQQYEISNFAREGTEASHNLLYWDGGDFLGIGPSAASRVFLNGRFHHRKQVSEMSRYMEGAFEKIEFESTSVDQTLLEASFLELRKNAGVSLSKFRERYDFDLTTASKYPLFEKEGLVIREGDTLRLSRRGLMLADSVTPELVS